MPESQSDIEARLETLRAELGAVISEIARIPTVMPIEQSHSNIQHGLNLNSKKERLEREIAKLKAKIPVQHWATQHAIKIVMFIVATVTTILLTLWINDLWSHEQEDIRSTKQQPQPGTKPEIETPTVE